MGPMKTFVGQARMFHRAPLWLSTGLVSIHPIGLYSRLISTQYYTLLAIKQCHFYGTMTSAFHKIV